MHCAQEASLDVAGRKRSFKPVVHIGAAPSNICNARDGPSLA